MSKRIKLYHGSPHRLDEIRPTVATGKGDASAREHAIYLANNPEEARLYALTRPRNNKRKGWAILNNKVHYVKGDPINKQGYVYEHEFDDYAAPPESDPGIGYRVYGAYKPTKRKRVRLRGIEDQFVEHPDKASYKDAVKSWLASREKTSSYREGGSFTHEGIEYDLDHALSLADKQPVTSTRVKDLAWVLRHGKADPERVQRADLSAPLLVSHTSDGRPTVIDGFHRLTKAKNRGVASMPTRFVDRKELRKTSAVKHTLVTGHSGAGKSTLARSFGLPIHALDDDPDIREQLNRQMAYAKANQGRLPLGKQYDKDMRHAEERAIDRAMALKDPHVIEGSYLLNRDPEDFKAHNMHLVDTPEDVVLDRRVERQRIKDLARNRHWDDERAKGVRMRGQQLIDEYAPGVKRWRGSDYVKKAALKKEVELRPHQKDALQTLHANEGRALFAHGTGTGKTLTSIASFEDLRAKNKAKRALVVAPASLLTNFREQGVQKFTDSSVSAVGGNGDYQLVSLEKFRRDPQAVLDQANADTLIIDEMHRSRNPSSTSFESLRTATRDKRIKNVIGLTGSIVSNHPQDIVPLADIIRDKHALGSRSKFTKEHVKVKKISGGFLKPPSTKYDLYKKDALRSKVDGLIHYVGNSDMEGMPGLKVDDINVEMSKDQQKLYDFAMGKLNPVARARIRSGLPPSQSEAQHIFGMITKLRQASNSVGTHNNLSPAESAESTPKLKRVLDDVQEHIKNTKDGQAVVYSNLVNGGAKELYEGLKARGIQAGLYTGPNKDLGVTKSSRDAAVRRFTAGKDKAIILTGAGGEGLSLNNATMFAAVDPHFNPERNWQAIARARRFGGLAHRPKKDRIIQVNRYQSTPRQSVLGKAIFGKEVGVDEWMQRVADEKDRLNSQIRSISQNVTDTRRGLNKKASKQVLISRQKIAAIKDLRRDLRERAVKTASVKKLLWHKFIEPILEEDAPRVHKTAKQLRNMVDKGDLDLIREQVSNNENMTRRKFLRYLAQEGLAAQQDTYGYLDNIARAVDQQHDSYSLAEQAREVFGTALGHTPYGAIPGALLTNTGTMATMMAAERPFVQIAEAAERAASQGYKHKSAKARVKDSLERIQNMGEDFAEQVEAFNKGDNTQQGLVRAGIAKAKQGVESTLDENARKYGYSTAESIGDLALQQVPLGQTISAMNRALRAGTKHERNAALPPGVKAPKTRAELRRYRKQKDKNRLGALALAAKMRFGALKPNRTDPHVATMVKNARLRSYYLKDISLPPEFGRITDRYYQTHGQGQLINYGLDHYDKRRNPRKQRLHSMDGAYATKTAQKGVATKTDPAAWARAKAQARAKMGGKHSARAMQLATQIYKKNGGGYSGAKPSSGSNKLKKWTKQKWQWSGKDTPGPGGTGVYLPKRSSDQLKSTRAGRDKLRAAAAAKRAATNSGRQFSSHGLHVGKKRSDVR
jgi:superfamily II DNA or RNA helicase